MYLLDSNVFIDASNRHYKMNCFPGFWDWLLVKNEDEVVFSTADIRNELKKKPLRSWASSQGRGLFLPEADRKAEPGRMESWLLGQRYALRVQAEWLKTPDASLIAEALAQRAVVVTHEVAAPNSKTKIKIPDVCAGLGVPCIDPFIMLEQEKARFVLPRP